MKKPSRKDSAADHELEDEALEGHMAWMHKHRICGVGTPLSNVDVEFSFRMGFKAAARALRAATRKKGGRRG